MATRSRRVNPDPEGSEGTVLSRDQHQMPAPIEPEPPVPMRRGEVVCRSCRLVVRRPELKGAALLVCDDCVR